jgi:hypothetical protein
MSAGTLRALLAAGCFAAPAEASAQIAPLSAAELYASCMAYRDEPGGGSACSAYIRGFLDGSRTSRSADRGSPKESFHERALRTRAGSRYAGLMRYCLAAPVSLDQLVDALLTRPVVDPDGTPASTAVHLSLRRIHDCRRR